LSILGGYVAGNLDVAPGDFSMHGNPPLNEQRRGASALT
jgi:hypothetical protein